MPGGVGGEGPGSPVLPYPDSVTKHLPPQEVAAGGGWGDIQALTLLY